MPVIGLGWLLHPKRSLKYHSPSGNNCKFSELIMRSNKIYPQPKSVAVSGELGLPGLTGLPTVTVLSAASWRRTLRRQPLNTHDFQLSPDPRLRFRMEDPR